MCVIVYNFPVFYVQHTQISQYLHDGSADCAEFGNSL